MNTWNLVEDSLRLELVEKVIKKTCPYCGNEFDSRGRTVDVKKYYDDSGGSSKVRIIDYPDYCSKLCKRLANEEEE